MDLAIAKLNFAHRCDESFFQNCIWLAKISVRDWRSSCQCVSPTQPQFCLSKVGGVLRRYFTLHCFWRVEDSASASVTARGWRNLRGKGVSTSPILTNNAFVPDWIFERTFVTPQCDFWGVAWPWKWCQIISKTISVAAFVLCRPAGMFHLQALLKKSRETYSRLID